MHCHSTFSDGVFSPQELLSFAQQKELTIFSITDHDTIDGTNIAKEQSEEFSFMYLTGIELSSRYEKQKIEILGYNFDVLHKNFNQKLKLLQMARKQRIHKVIARLEEIDIDITYEDIMKQIGEGVSAGRPHFARALVENGHVKTVKEAFEKYLGVGKPGYVRRETIEPEEAIKIIHSAKGTTILPHPLLVEVEDIEKLEYYLNLLLSWGLEGIEVYYNYSYHCPHLSERTVKNGILFLEKFCKKNDLLMTGGSDLHDHKAIFGEVKIPEDEIQKLIQHFTV